MRKTHADQDWGSLGLPFSFRNSGIAENQFSAIQANGCRVRVWEWLCGMLVMVLIGSGCGSPPAVEEPKQPVAKKVVKEKTPEQKNAVVPAKRPPADKAAAPVPERTFEALLAQAEAEKEKPLDPLRFPLPTVDEEKCEARRIRKLESKHLTLYTDLPAAPAVDELPQIFELALPQWLAYFQIDPARAAEWKMMGILAQEKERFYETGLWPDDLPPFLHGYMRGRTFWLYEQPSDFYRRELVLHEGTHGFMWNFLGGVGPPWYAEGSAELLGTHEWKDGQLKLGVIPPSKQASPMWGRVKVIKDAYAAGKALGLAEVLTLPPGAHLQTEAYAWSWGASVFFDHDPQFQKPFRELKDTVADVTQNFSERFINRLPQPPNQLSEQWQCFVANIEYGYDVARESIVRQESKPLPDSGGEYRVLANRGWQSSGFALQAGKTYVIQAAGEFQIGASTKPWMSDANGITLRYYHGRPIGQLLAAITDEGKSNTLTPLVKPTVIGMQGELKCEKDGVLYLRVNDSPAELADNAGELAVTIKLKP